MVFLGTRLTPTSPRILRSEEVIANDGASVDDRLTGSILIK